MEVQRQTGRRFVVNGETITTRCVADGNRLAESAGFGAATDFRGGHLGQHHHELLRRTAKRQTRPPADKLAIEMLTLDKRKELTWKLWEPSCLEP